MSSTGQQIRTLDKRVSGILVIPHLDELNADLREREVATVQALCARDDHVFRVVCCGAVSNNHKLVSTHARCGAWGP